MAQMTPIIGKPQMARMPPIVGRPQAARMTPIIGQPQMVRRSADSCAGASLLPLLVLSLPIDCPLCDVDQILKQLRCLPMSEQWS